METVTVIIPTTGAKTVGKAEFSVFKQNYPHVTPYTVVDGEEYSKAYGSDRGSGPVCRLPINVGANGFYGHRIYAAFTHLVNTDYVMYLDQDCWFEPDHVVSCINKIEHNGLDWCYSLRRICDVDGNYLLDDNCESLGRFPTYHGLHHIDTNCYCIKTEVATKIASVWHGRWGQDRVFFQALSHHFPKYDCTGKYTVNYRLAGNPGSVTKEFFENGNRVMQQKYNGEYPWVKV